MLKKLFCLLAVLAIAGSANAALIAYYNFGTSAPTSANQGTAGTAADGVLMNGATIVDIDTSAAGVEWVLQLSNDSTNSGFANHQYMNITNGDDTWYDNAIGTPLGARTYAAWVRMNTDTTQTWSMFMSKGYETTLALGCGTPFGNGMDQVVFSYQTGFAAWSPLKGKVSAMGDTYWIHVTATIDGEDYKTASLYINGLLQDSRQTWGPLYQNDLDLLIGDEPNRTGFDFAWNGMLDDVRIYDTAMDASGVLDLFNSTYSPFRPAINPRPFDGETFVHLNVNLLWNDINASPYDVYFGTDINDVNSADNSWPVGTTVYKGSVDSNSWDPNGLEYGTTYYWRIDGMFGQTRLKGDLWSFTTIIAAPYPASNPGPGNGDTDISVEDDLNWSAGSGASSHDVYFGSSSPGALQGNQSTTTFDPGTMANDTTYYWRIDEVNAGGTTTGTVWTFTTEAVTPLPGQATNPNPADSATDVGVGADLSWTAGSNATSRDVYFGTSSPGTFQDNQSTTTFDPGIMAYETTYYWRIDAVNAGGTTTGTVWSFTTGSGLLAHYTFDNADGRNYGTAGSAADGVLTNDASIVYDPVGQWNKEPNYVLLLNYGDGTVHQYMNIGSDWFNTSVPNAHPLTIAAWIKVTPGTLGDWRTIMSKGYESSWNLAMGTPLANSDQAVYSVHAGIASWMPLKATVNVRDGQWHHVAGTIDEQDYKTASLYVDGVLQDSRQTWTPCYSNDLDILIGDEPTRQNYNFQWNGMIDDVRIYNEALTEAKIGEIYMGHPPDIALTVNVEPNDIGIDTVIPGPGQYMYYQNWQVHLTANNFVDCPDVYKLLYWEGDVVDPNAAETIVIMSEEKTVTAVFADSRECGDECHPILKGDLNGDCYINFDDFAMYCDQWLSCTAPECD